MGFGTTIVFVLSSLDELDSMMKSEGGDDGDETDSSVATRAASRSSQAAATLSRGDRAFVQGFGRRSFSVTTKAEVQTQDADDDAADAGGDGQHGLLDSMEHHAGDLPATKRRRTSTDTADVKTEDADASDDDRPCLGCQRSRHHGVC